MQLPKGALSRNRRKPGSISAFLLDVGGISVEVVVRKAIKHMHLGVYPRKKGLLRVAARPDEEAVRLAATLAAY